MAKKKKTTNKTATPEVAVSVPELDVYGKMELYEKMTGLKLDKNCHLDKEFATLWYETKYLSGVHCRWIFIPKGSITHYGDGKIYRGSNITDAIAERLMKENPAYKELFIDLTKEN